jgi:hypothetical protein
VNFVGIKCNINSHCHSIQHSLSCPVNTNDPLFKIKCDALFFNEMPKSSDISSTIELPDCKTIPIFKIPLLVKDSNKYKKKTYHDIQKYNNEIQTKIDDLKKLEAEKYIKLVKYQKGNDLSLEDAYKEINKRPLNSIINENIENWKVYKNMDAAQSLFYENEKNTILQYYGKVFLSAQINGTESSH